MKVKVFETDISSDFEKIINEFIKGKKVVDIKYNAIPDLERNITIYTALVMYEEMGY